MKKAIGIIQARCSSLRLPGKVLLPLADIPMIQHIFSRANSCDMLNDVIVATSEDQTDLPLVHFCEENGIPVFTGCLNNVLSRYVNILSVSEADYFVRITGDSPLIHPEFIDFQIKLLRSKNADFIRLVPGMSLLDGQGVMSARSLRYIAKNTTNKFDFEHVGSMFIEENFSSFKVIPVRVISSFHEVDVSLSVDRREDYDFIADLYDRFYDGEILDLTNIVKFLEQDQSLLKRRRNRLQSDVNLTLEKIRLLNMETCEGEAIWVWN